MESIYLGIVLFLFLLAIFDLVVGVSNDAVNFLGSAVGARAASFKWIMGVAAVGILCGAVMSNGMMDVARHGIFRPEQFYFQDIMCICLAVMAIDVILLDTFNTLGLPTSTTVSIVFELLGGAFALAMVKLAADDTGLTFADMLNSEKALSVIMAIFLSVAIAFVFGAVVQYIARLIFTFNYKSHMKWSAALFGGVAMTAIIYFILIKGMKDSSFMTPELSEWISTYTRHLVAGCFIFFCLLSQVLHWCRINIFKVVTLLGTFALALAFAGNDLVNFVGVPLTGYFLYGLRRQRQRIRNLPDGFAERACPDALHFPGSFGRGDDRRPDHFAEGPGRYQDLGGSGPSGCRRRDVRFVGAGPEYRACFVVPRYRNRQCDAAGTEALARETLR